MTAHVTNELVPKKQADVELFRRAACAAGEAWLLRSDDIDRMHEYGYKLLRYAEEVCDQDTMAYANLLIKANSLAEFDRQRQLLAPPSSS